MPSAPSTRSPRRLRRALAAVALLAAALGGGATATPAAAAAFSAGILDAGDSYSFDSLGIGAGLAAPGATFDDTVSFTLTAALGLNSRVAFTSLPGLALVDGASVRLYRDGNPVALVSGVSGPPGGGLFSNAFSVAALSAGAYTLVVSGFGSGTLGGGYSGSITAVPALAVPELPAWASLVAGLALLATLARRRATRLPTLAPLDGAGVRGLS